MIIGLIVALHHLSNNKLLSYFNIYLCRNSKSYSIIGFNSLDILWSSIILGVSFSPFVSGIIALTISEECISSRNF